MKCSDCKYYYVVKYVTSIDMGARTPTENVAKTPSCFFSPPSGEGKRAKTRPEWFCSEFTPGPACLQRMGAGQYEGHERETL